MMRKTIRCIMAFALALHGFGLPASISAEPPKTLSCIKLETLIEANEQDFAAFRKRNRIDIDQNGITANEVADLTTMAAVMLFLGAVGSGFVVMGSKNPAMREEFNRLQDKNRELRKQAAQENCRIPPSTAPWKTVNEILFPTTTFEPGPGDEELQD